jgi:hypothetical protein
MKQFFNALQQLSNLIPGRKYTEATWDEVGYWQARWDMWEPVPSAPISQRWL